ncbi:exodeoxyribonuclease I [Candidatus Saccharibacteria bacterium]|nr:exodeoxyribonuclease I [Candidatus Saccharibacteria bacterium]
MAQTYFFYDLETSGLQARSDRIMQFAGQRTDMNLRPIGDPYNILVTLNDDTLPSPDALMVTGISPQKTVQEGYSEADFCKTLIEEVFTQDTIAVGFNNIRFDDEFVRHLLWRNFYDPYEWSWRDGRSRWDMLDVVRMTRALRPQGIVWPVDANGKPTNRLELLTKENNIAHESAHDALSDVHALISVAQLIRKVQPQLYEYLLRMRDKKSVQSLVNLAHPEPFVYTSGRYDAEYQKTTVAMPLTAGKNGNIVVYDLRYDPTNLINLDSSQLAKKLYATWEERQNPEFVALPVKELQFNRAPAVAPLNVLEKGGGWEAINLNRQQVEAHQQELLRNPHFAENIRSLFESRPDYKKMSDPEAQLYDGFLNDRDKLRVEIVRNADESQLADYHPDFVDERLPGLLLHYKARNYPQVLSEAEATQWELWRSTRVTTQLPEFLKSLERVSRTANDTQQFMLQELQLWAESILPVDD